MKIGELLLLRDSPTISCGEIKEQTEKKIVDIEQKITDLELIKNSLVKVGRFLSRCWHYGKVPHTGKD